jgi:hypothetical protein
VHVCDPSTLHPLSPAWPARIVDISLGGMRVEVPQLPDSIGDSLGPGAVVGISSAEPVLSLGSLHLQVVWFNHRLGGEAFSSAAFGASYRKASEADRAALVRFASGGGAAPSPASRSARRWRVWAALAAVATAVLLWWASSWRALPGSPEPAPESEEAPQVERIPPAAERPESAAEVPPPVAGKEMAAALAEEPDSPKPLEFSVAGAPEGVTMASLELVHGDFVGALVSTLSDDRGLTVTLEYTCQGGSAGTPCRCQTPRMIIRAGRKTEFACTPQVPPSSPPQSVTVSLGAVRPGWE